MPTYEYECSNGHQFEVVQRITAEPVRECEVCGAETRRLISATSFILKGGGWYSDGYSRSKSGGSSQTASDGASGSSEGSEGSEGSGKSSSGTSSESAKTSSSDKASPPSKSASSGKSSDSS